MSKFLYLSDVIAQRQNERDAEQIRWAKEDAAQAKRTAKFTPRTDINPAIGVLVNKNGVRYYAFIDGAYTEGSPEHLSTLLTQTI
jgi:hypothetical protein